MRAKDVSGALLVFLAVILAAGGLYGTRYLKRPKFDPRTLCPLSGIAAATLVIVDKTDPVSVGQLHGVLDAIDGERKLLEQGAKMVILVLEQDGGGAVSARPILSLCNPGSEANPLYQNPGRVLTQYNESFLAPLEKALRSIARQGSAPISPIAHAIRQALADKDLSAVRRGKLILISDLLEHTAQGSAYNGTFTAGTLEKILTPEASALLRKFSVKILLLRRPHFEREQRAAKDIWFGYFRNLSGSDPAIGELGAIAQAIPARKRS
jgi:hypothetical protein